MFGEVVLNIPFEDFENVLSDVKKTANVQEDCQLSDDQLADLVTRYKDVYRKHGKEFPQDPIEQLYMSGVLAP